jgi:hypothetical protein
MAAAQQTPPSVEAMNEVLAYLVNERQHLRTHGATKVELEANRKAIVSMQWRLNRAMGLEHASSHTC